MQTARLLLGPWAQDALRLLLWVKKRSQLHPVGRCGPFLLVPMLSRERAEKILYQPQQLRRKPHWDVTSSQVKANIVIIPIRPRDKGMGRYEGSPAEYPEKTHHLTTTGNASGNGGKLCCQGITKPDATCRTGATFSPAVGWDDKRCPLWVKDFHHMGQESLPVPVPQGQPAQAQSLLALAPIFTKGNPEQRWM